MHVCSLGNLFWHKPAGLQPHQPWQRNATLLVPSIIGHSRRLVRIARQTKVAEVVKEKGLRRRQRTVLSGYQISSVRQLQAVSIMLAYPQFECCKQSQVCCCTQSFCGNLS